MGLHVILTVDIFAMANVFRPTLQLAALSPLTAWSVIQAIKGISADMVEHRRSVFLYLSLAALLLFTQWVFLDSVRAAIRANRLGCKPVKPYPFPKKEVVAGMRRAFKEHRVMDALKARLDTVGHTFVDNGPWGGMIITDEPEIVKTIQSTNFEDWDIAGPRLWSAVQNFGRRSIFTNNGAKCKPSFDLDLEAGECRANDGRFICVDLGVWTVSVGSNADSIEIGRAARDLIKPAFVRDEIADLAAFDRHVSRFLEHIPKDGSTVDLQPLFLKLTMDSSTDFL